MARAMATAPIGGSGRQSGVAHHRIAPAPPTDDGRLDPDAPAGCVPRAAAREQRRDGQRQRWMNGGCEEEHHRRGHAAPRLPDPQRQRAHDQCRQQQDDLTVRGPRRDGAVRKREPRDTMEG